MAVCNLFRQLTKETGNFIMFDQYSDDLTRCYVQHDNYCVMPSKFVVCDIDYSKLKSGVRQSINYNEMIPTYFQNYIENGCAWLKSESIIDGLRVDQSQWLNNENWTPKISSNIFWNSLVRDGLITPPQDYDYYWKQQEGVKIPENDDYKAYPTFKEVKYVGKIDIHSYEETDGVGYNEIYCYIPNSAAETLYKVTTIKGSLAYTYPYDYCMGCDVETADILGVLPVNINVDRDPAGYQSPDYLYEQQYTFAGCELDGEDFDYYNNFSLRDKNEFLNLYNLPTSNSFTFNTIFVLYDIVNKDESGNINVIHKDIPMGVYFTGKFDDRGNMTNNVTKYAICEDAYNSGTSYGLRICTRYMCTPNATTIDSIEIDTGDQYAGFSQAMDAMKASQQKMDEILEQSISSMQGIKDHLASFKNSKANCPYIRKIGNDYYWFINGRNTGVTANGNKGADGKNGTILELVEKDGTFYWALDGLITAVRAEGKDGLRGPEGKEGPAGANGHTPKIDIRKSTKSNNLTWFIDGEDTFVQASASNGKNGVNGKNGYTPELIEGPDGANYWSINGQSTGVRANGVDGRSIHSIGESGVKSNGKYLINTTSDFWTKGDSVLYVGTNDYPSYELSRNSILRLTEYVPEQDAWNYMVVGRISVYGGEGLIDNINDILVENEGDTRSITIKSGALSKRIESKNTDNHRVSHYMSDRKYNYITDRVYCDGKPFDKDQTYLEIPYGRIWVKNSDGTYNFYITIDPKYSGLNGCIIIRPTKLDKVFDSEGHEANNYENILLNTVTYKKDEETLGLKIDDKHRYLIWKNLTEAEKKAVNHSYSISKHIGKVFAFVDLYTIYGKENITLNDVNSKLLGAPQLDSFDSVEIVNSKPSPFNINRVGVSYYSVPKSGWIVNKDIHNVRVGDTDKIPQSSNITHPRDIFELLKEYDLRQSWIYKKRPIRSKGVSSDTFELIKNGDMSWEGLHRSEEYKGSINRHYEWISNKSKIGRYKYISSEDNFERMDQLATLLLGRQAPLTSRRIPIYTGQWNDAERYYHRTKIGKIFVPYSELSDKGYPSTYVKIAFKNKSGEYDVYKISLHWMNNSQYDETKIPVNSDAIDIKLSKYPNLNYAKVMENGKSYVKLCYDDARKFFATFKCEYLNTVRGFKNTNKKKVDNYRLYSI